MNCEEFQGRYLAGETGADTKAHLDGCTWCRGRLEDLDELQTLLGTSAMWEAPADDLEDIVVSSLRRGSKPAISTNKLIKWLGAVAALAVIVAGAAVYLQRDVPDWDIALPASSGFEATATVAGWNTPAGTRMIFTIDGLEPAGANKFYEIWLTATDGRHVSAGTFTGSGTIESFAGVSRRDFPRIWITLEPNDGDEGIGGPTVLDTDS